MDLIPRSKLTPARRRAISVIAAAMVDRRNVRVSNVTSKVGADDPTVYWQSWDWLRDQGLAETEKPWVSVWLTVDGLALANRERII